MDTITSNTKLENNPTVILFVGSNPSNASTTNIAFHAQTKSSKILTGWSKDLPGIKVHINVLNEKTDNNRPLNNKEIKLNLERLAIDIKCSGATKIVALGKTAAKALSMMGVPHYEMPHPSGRNRKLNDANYVAAKVKGLTDYISNPSGL